MKRAARAERRQALDATDEIKRYLVSRAEQFAARRAEPRPTDPGVRAAEELGIAICMLRFLLIERGDSERIERKFFREWRAEQAKAAGALQ